MSESNTGHAYVDWGDIARVERINGGLLGAELGADLSAKRYPVKIYPGENWDESRRSPLTESGINVQEGDYLLRINGEELTTAQNPYELLENLGNRHVELTVNNSPTLSGAKKFNVKTITSEVERYVIWTG